MKKKVSKSQESNPNLLNTVDRFFRGAFSVDIALFTFHEGKLKILLQQKEEEPFVDDLGLPGKLILPNEDTDIALDRLLLSLIGSNRFYKKQLRAFSELSRHPLGRVISIVYYGLIPYEQLQLPLSGRLSWLTLEKIPQLSYDHNYIFKQVLKRFKKGLLRHPTVFELLPKEFTISNVIAIYEQAFSKKIDASNFGKMIRKSEVIIPLNKLSSQPKNGRPANLFCFNRDQYYKQPKDRIQFNF